MSSSSEDSAEVAGTTEERLDLPPTAERAALSLVKTLKTPSESGELSRKGVIMRPVSRVEGLSGESSGTPGVPPVELAAETVTTGEAATPNGPPQEGHLQAKGKPEYQTTCSLFSA
jgi:hypothetical protein